MKGLLTCYLHSIRIHDWWKFLLTPIFSLYWLGLSVPDSNPVNLWRNFTGFFLLTFATASFGFFVNEWSDIRDDARAGKMNRLRDAPGYVFVFCAMMIILQLVAGLYLFAGNSSQLILLAIQFLILILYSAEPFRLKKNLVAAPLLDSAYNGALFFLLGYYAFQPSVPFSLLSVSIFCWGFTKGLRNYLLHLLEDADHDKKAQIQTAGTLFKPGKIRDILYAVILPLEIAFFFLLCCDHGRLGMVMFLSLITFLILVLAPVFSKDMFLKRFHTEYGRDKLLDLNKFYEIVMPLLVLTWIIPAKDPHFAFFIPVLFIFPNMIKAITFPFFLIRQFFRTFRRHGH